VARKSLGTAGVDQSVFVIKFCRATIRVKWLNGEKTNVSPFNHLTRMAVRENFIILSRRESSRSSLFSWTYQMAHSKAELKNSGDKHLLVSEHSE
jgi:hypothetical protein